MDKAVLHNEQERLDSLRSHDILDTISESEYDDIVALASQICNTPISLVSLVDKDRQWFKAKVGLEVDETPRDIAFCSHAIACPDDVFVVEDAATDLRFHQNPLVTNDPYIRFYAGAILRSVDGHNLGTLCVIDREPRQLSAEQLSALEKLANIVSNHIYARKKSKVLEITINALERTNKSLSEFASILAHDLRSPLNSMQLATSLLAEEESIAGDESLMLLIHSLQRGCTQQSQMIESVLHHARQQQISPKFIASFYFGEVTDELMQKYGGMPGIDWLIEGESTQIVTDSQAFLRIMDNLVSNAIKYCEKPKLNLLMKCEIIKGDVRIMVSDNGCGISESELPHIFDMLKTTKNNVSRTIEGSTGIGLSIVKTLVHKLGGEVSVHSEVDKGSTFTFYITNLTDFSTI